MFVTEIESHMHAKLQIPLRTLKKITKEDSHKVLCHGAFNSMSERVKCSGALTSPWDRLPAVIPLLISHTLLCSLNMKNDMNTDRPILMHQLNNLDVYTERSIFSTYTQKNS